MERNPMYGNIMRRSRMPQRQGVHFVTKNCRIVEGQQLYYAIQIDNENPGIVCTAIPLAQLGLINLQVVHRLQTTITIPQHCYGQLH